MSPRRREFRALLGLAAPIVLANLGTMLLHVVDLIMVGRISTADLAAASLGGFWISATILAAMGVVMGIDPIVSQAHGAKDGDRAGIALQQGILVGLATSVLVALAWAFTEDCLLFLRQDPELAARAHDYMIVQIPSIPCFTTYVALRQYLQCREIIFPSVVVTLGANVFNWIFNEVLIFGFGSFEGYGLEGAGIATGLSRGVMFGGLALYTWRAGLHHGAWPGWTKRAFEWHGLSEVIRHGMAVGSHIGLEVWAFSASTAMAGILAKNAGTPDTLAAHQTVMSLASVTFMMPMGIGSGVVTRVGNLIGAARHEDAQRAAWVAFLMGGGVMCVSALLLFSFRWALPRAYSLEGEALRLAAWILPIAATFQIFDGLQVVGSGILRGMGRTTVSAIINLIGYWLLALPLAWWMAFHTELALSGIWWGLCIGLALVATMLLNWVRIAGPATLAPTPRPDLRAESTS